jgi:hypothetical protein
MPDDVDHSSAAGRLCTPRPTASTGLGQDPCGATASSPLRVVAARGARCCPGRPRTCYDHGLGQRHASPGQVRPTCRQRGTDEPAISAIAPNTGGAKVRSDKVTHWLVSVEHAADVARRIRSVNCHG